MERRTYCLNPYFVGKCSTAFAKIIYLKYNKNSLNPYFVGKCSTALNKKEEASKMMDVLILILLENALRQPDSVLQLKK